MSRAALATLSILFAAFGALAHASDTLSFDPSRFALEQGVYCKLPTVDLLPAPDTEAGQINLFNGIPDFLAQTHRVPAVIGLGFGLKVRVLDNTLYDPVTVVVTHPPFQGTGTSRQSYFSIVGDRDVSITAYSFDIERELAIGTWAFSVRYGGEELYSAQFDVVSPALAPNYAAYCTGDLMS